MVLVFYVRYRQVEEFCKLPLMPENIRNLNKTALWLGIIASLGVSIVGNFQESNVFSVHLIGAFLAFGLGTVYAGIQVRI